MQREKDISFKAQLDTMLDPKYKKAADIDEDFEAARRGALLVLQQLTGEAKAKKTETDKILQELVAVGFAYFYIVFS